MIRITKLHLLFLALIVATAGVYVYQIQQETIRRQEKALQDAQRQIERMRREAEEHRKREQEALYLQGRIAEEVVAVAGEYWQLAKQEGRDLTQGQTTLHQAKETLKLKDFPLTVELARQSITELRKAPLLDLYYSVVRGDSLWKIAKMPRHYNHGRFWGRIWKANRTVIHNPRLIYPSQKLKIPRVSGRRP